MDFTPFPTQQVEPSGPSGGSLRRFADAPRGWLTGIGLYLLAVIALLWVPIDNPPFHLSWEDYAGWKFFDAWVETPSLDLIFGYSDGLAADSARGPLIGPFLWIGHLLGGVGYAPLRLAVALECAFAVPLLWRVARKVLPNEAAILTAVLFALSPVWVFYGRNVTSTGASALVLLVTMLGLLGVLEARDWVAWRWPMVLLAGGIVLSLYAYTPARAMWPMATVLLLAAAAIYRSRWRMLVLSAAIVAVIFPLAVVVMDLLFANPPNAGRALDRIMHGANEQILGMTPESVDTWLREGNKGTGFAGLLRQNAGDLVNLLFNRETRPVRTDYWNAHGRLWSVPFAIAAIAGVGTLSWLAWTKRTISPLVVMAVAAGLLVGPVFTSLVHVGRLAAALPLLMIMVGAGAWGIGTAVATLVQRAGVPFSSAVFRWVPMGAMLVFALALFAAEGAVELGPTRQALEVDMMSAEAPYSRRLGVAIALDPGLGSEIEHVRMGAYRLGLGDGYVFTEDVRAPRDAGEDIPVRYLGTLVALEAGMFDKPCNTMWFVQPEVEERFLDAFAAAGCDDTSDVFILPR